MNQRRQVRPITDIITLDWGKQGEEWLSRFEQSLVERDAVVRMTGFLYDTTTMPFIEVGMTSADGDERYKLLIAPMDIGIYLLVDIGVDIPAEVHEAWVASAARASKRLGEHYTAHEWSAIIGPSPSRLGEARAGVDVEGLLESGSFGRLKFVSSDRYLLELVRNPEIPSFNSGHLIGSIPITVTGSSRGYSWNDASVNAARG